MSIIVVKEHDFSKEFEKLYNQKKAVEQANKTEFDKETEKLKAYIADILSIKIGFHNLAIEKFKKSKFFNKQYKLDVKEEIEFALNHETYYNHYHHKDWVIFQGLGICVYSSKNRCSHVAYDTPFQLVVDSNHLSGLEDFKNLCMKKLLAHD